MGSLSPENPWLPAMVRSVNGALGCDPDPLMGCEEAAVESLVAAYESLQCDDEGRIDTRTQAGLDACSSFLDEINRTAEAFRLPIAPRDYRLQFTINYQTLFPDEARNYRVDMLEASLEEYRYIWVNGDKFEFSDEAVSLAEALHKAWAELLTLLEKWGSGMVSPRYAKPNRQALVSALMALDFTWARFEQKYIGDLIAIEDKARSLIVQAIEHDKRLREMEKSSPSSGPGSVEESPEYMEEQVQLVACVAQMNAVANFRRKGRDDFRADVLREASAKLRSIAEEGSSSNPPSAAQILCSDVCESWKAMRRYLQEVENCLECVDPHLCNNSGLVTRLVDWEECWETGVRYVQNAAMLSALCDLVSEIRAAQKFVPGLSAMCDECAVGLFLFLPRMVWLCFLDQPRRHSILLKSLLPHRFASAADDDTEDPALEPIISAYNDMKRVLLDEHMSESDAWELLVQRIVAGADAMGERYSERFGAQSKRVAGIVEDLMRDLEGWSIELQRHCPDEWNQCSAILVQCLTETTSHKPREGPFCV